MGPSDRYSNIPAVASFPNTRTEYAVRTPTLIDTLTRPSCDGELAEVTGGDGRAEEEEGFGAVEVQGSAIGADFERGGAVVVRRRNVYVCSYRKQPLRYSKVASLAGNIQRSGAAAVCPRDIFDGANLEKPLTH